MPLSPIHLSTIAAIQARGKSKKIAEKRLDLRKTLWPSLDASRLWDRKKSVGFATISPTVANERHLSLESLTSVEIWTS